MPDLVLASTSPYRRALLERLGLPFRTRDPKVDEASFLNHALAPPDLAELLAIAKVESVLSDEAESVVVASDQLVAFEGRIHGKPGTDERARAQLLAMAGKSHDLITSMVVWHRGRWFHHTDVTKLWMRALHRDEVERYVAADRPLDCAGSYKLEQRGITLFDRIESRDHTAITGLPLIALTTILRGLGYTVP